jgi:hypothetical protein
MNTVFIIVVGVVIGIVGAGILRIIIDYFTRN